VVPSLIDIGANLTHESFRNDLDSVLERARSSGVRRLIVTGTNLPSSEEALELASSRPGVLWCTAGVHPHSAADYDDETENRLRVLLTDPRVVAAGECGLDYYRDFAPRDVQREAFSRQLELAAASGRPVFLHQRDAHPDFLAVLAEQGHSMPAGVAHCFTNGPAEVTDYLDLGLYIGVTGWICDAVRSIPLDRIVVETDSPYLLPRSIRPVPRNRRNEPATLPEVVRTLALHMGHSADVVAEATTKNAERLFGLSVA
jgi:TatD DNase family protein